MAEEAVHVHRSPMAEPVSVVFAASGLVALVAMAWISEHYAHGYFIGHYDFLLKDLYGRLANLQNLRATGNIYLPFGYQAFTYPPAAVLFFWPILWIPLQHLWLAWNLLSLAALAAALAGAINSLQALRPAVVIGSACWAAVISALVIQPVVECLGWGQTATFLLLAVVLDMLVTRGPAKGVLVGLACAVKIYPGVFILAWLWRRQWRPALTAIITVVSLNAVAWVVWPMSGSSYWHDVVRGGLELRKLASAVTAFASSSVGAALMRPPFHEYSFTSSERLLVSALVLVVGFVASHRLWRLHLEVSAMVILLIVSTICAPVAWDHYFAYSPMFVVMAWELEWKGVLAWVGLAATLVMTVPWYDFRHPHPHTWWTVTYAFSARGAIFFVVLAILIASFWQKRPGMIRTAPRADAVATNDAMASDPLA